MYISGALIMRGRIFQYAGTYSSVPVRIGLLNDVSPRSYK